MKALNCKLKIVLLGLIMTGTGVFAQEVSKDLHEEFSTSKQTILSVDAKFSKLTLENWDRDQAVFDVKVKVEHPDKSTAQKILDGIQVQFEQENGEISLATIFKDGLTEKNMGKDLKMSVDIVGKVPSYINLEIDSKFGSAGLGEFSGNAILDISFGELEAEKITGNELVIDVSHSDCMIGYLANAEVEVSFGSLHVQTAGDLSLEVNQGEFTCVSAGNLSAEVNMGSCTIEKIDPSFSNIEIETNAGNVEIGIDKNAGFSLSAEMKMGNIDLPSELGKMTADKSGLQSSFEGKYGNGKSSVSLEGKMANIEIKLK